MEARAEFIWKWLLRAVGLVLLGVVFLEWHEAPIAVYVLIGGLLGLPSVWALQRGVNGTHE